VEHSSVAGGHLPVLLLPPPPPTRPNLCCLVDEEASREPAVLPALEDTPPPFPAHSNNWADTWLLLPLPFFYSALPHT
jgi:hypothetical protein